MRKFGKHSRSSGKTTQIMNRQVSRVPYPNHKARGDWLESSATQTSCSAALACVIQTERWLTFSQKTFVQLPSMLCHSGRLLGGLAGLGLAMSPGDLCHELSFRTDQSSGIEEGIFRWCLGATCERLKVRILAACLPSRQVYSVHWDRRHREE